MQLTAKAALNTESSPEVCDIFLPPFLAVLISLHMSWTKIQFVWKRRGYYWLNHCLLIVCVCVCSSAQSLLSVCVYPRAHVCELCVHQGQPIHNSNGLCFSHISLSMQLTSAVPAYLMAKTQTHNTKKPPTPLSTHLPSGISFPFFFFLFGVGGCCVCVSVFLCLCEKRFHSIVGFQQLRVY